MIARKLRAEGRFHGVLQNYRKSGEAYPVRSTCGRFSTGEVSRWRTCVRARGGASARQAVQ